MTLKQGGLSEKNQRFLRSDRSETELLRGFETEGLATDGGFVHQAAFGVKKACHALDIFARELFAGLGPGADSGGRAGTAGGGLCTSGDGNCRCRSVEREGAADKFLLGTLILKENNFAEDLSA